MASFNGELVSVIIPTHNCRQWVSDAIDSALAQSYPSCELIVVDDGSVDDTGDYLGTKYGGQIRYVYQDNSGPAAARNKGLSLANGSFIQFLDSDDFLAPSKIERQMTLFSDQLECGVVYSDFAFMSIDKEGYTKQSPAQYRQKYGVKNVFEALLDSNFIVIHSALVRTDVLRCCGGFDMTLASDEDYDLWLRLAAAGCRFCFLPEVLAFYRRRHNSVSRDIFTQKKGTLQALKKVEQNIHGLTAQERTKLKLHLSREYGWMSRLYFQRGRIYKAVSLLAHAIVNNPKHGLAYSGRLLIRKIKSLLDRHVLWRFRIN